MLERKFAPIERAGISPGVARFRPRAAPGQRNALPAVPEQYHFAEKLEPLELKNEALAQLHVVFGGPGSGKSHFFMHVLRQLGEPQSWEQPWGGLLLDPKGTLSRRVATEIPSAKTFVVGGASSHPVNLLRTHLAPHDLGVALALSAQAAGIGGSEPYWTNQLKLLFGSGLAAIQLLGGVPTLGALATMLLTSIQATSNGRSRSVSALGVMIERLNNAELDDVGRRRRARILAVLDPFEAAKGNNADTTRSFIQQALAPFLDPDLDILSSEAATDSLADLIFRDGCWVVMDLPRTSLATSKFVATLVKVLFQQAALARHLIYPGQTRRVFMMIDEYAELGTDLPGEGFGDSIFFSQMREFRILALIATQGASMLKNSAVKDAWETILTNSASKLVFKINDQETAELASKQVGERDFVAVESSSQRSSDGVSASSSRRIERKSEFASGLFLGSLSRGQFAFLGSTDAVSAASVKFGRVV